MRRVMVVVAVAGFVGILSAQAQKALDIYLVDVEGGNVTLFVAPSGESLLIDTGNGGAAAARDGDRIIEVKDAPRTGELALTRLVSLPAGRVQPKEYPNFLKFIRTADDALSQSIRVRVRK